MALTDMNLLTLASCLVVVLGFTAPRAVAEDVPKIGSLPAGKVLFLGNSITLHAPAPDIGWTGNWGMAATAAEKDYVHRLTAAIARSTGHAPQIRVRNIADFERGYAAWDGAAVLREELAFGADIIFLAIGENVPELSGEAEQKAFASALDRLLAALKANGKPAIFVRSSFWANPVKDGILKSAAAAAGATFVDISTLGSDPTNAARSEREIAHAGVAGHPGDKGMKAIAEALLVELRQQAGLTLTLSSPSDFQVVQRTTKDSGTLTITGSVTPVPAALEARLLRPEDQDSAWQALTATFTGNTFTASVPAPAGGWFRLEVRAREKERIIAEADVAHVGIGEVFVVAGQSNSANHGEEKQTPKSGRVVSFDGSKWQPANDPQPGASGGGGSFLPPLGDALVEKLGVPVGFIACGIGATSVREWLPEGTALSHPPTLRQRVRQRADGTWESDGRAFAMLVARMKSAGPQGFRAVLWHQGESDANQKDPACTLPGELYQAHLKAVIRESALAIGRETPWFVAQVSYHIPGDEASPDIRAAQAALWQDGTALEGPDSDALKGPLRENNGQGVHFSGPGLRAHAARWAEKLIPWLETRLAEP